MNMTVYDDDMGTLREMHEWLRRRETGLRRCLAWIGAGVAVWLLVTSCREKPARRRETRLRRWLAWIAAGISLWLFVTSGRKKAARRPILAVSQVPLPPGGGGHP
jgi:hypothetical protein